ncbi:ricin-type beta-trefoil lectin domain protein [Kitasatospora sp. NPDC088160]|uniref:ricin-type beta-trefoil lectin domain protein n=1 Tax=Kitasatospora sp. NPDC088160 TaxID=3364072 RepID=UPI0038207189
MRPITARPFGADGTQGSHCWNSTGEGQHLQCANSTVNQGRPVTGHTYAFQVRIDPATHWVTATVTDETAGTSFGLGQSARWPLRFANGACLDRGGTNGAISYRCATTSNANQLFVFARDGSLHTAQGNECLAAPAAVGGQVVRAACDGSAAQRWSYDGARRAVVNPAGWALTSSTAGRNGDPVTARPADGSPEQTLTAVVRTDA